MKKVKILFNVIFLFVSLSLFAQNTTSIVDCSTVLILPQEDIDNSITEIDTTLDITMDSIWTDQNNFNIMFVLELSDTLDINGVHIKLGNTSGDSNLLNSFYNSTNNIDLEDLIYDKYSNFLNIQSGEFTVDSLLFYEIKIEDLSGNILSTFSDTIKK
ncbi:MAG: hypothetical protein ACPGSD_11330 [Flavobacteriales bacterium]